MPMLSIIDIILTLILIKSISGQCNFDDCFNCSASNCEWSSSDQKCKIQTNSNIYFPYLFNRFTNCIDSSSLEIQNTYCGQETLSSDSDSMDVELEYINGQYGTKNIFCQYTFDNLDDNKVILISIKISRNFASNIHFFIQAFFSDDSTQIRDVQRIDYSVSVTKARQVAIYYVGEDGFETNPFRMTVLAKYRGISITLIITIALVITACIICSVSIYIFSKRIRLRRENRMNMVTMNQMNMNQVNPNGNNVYYQNDIVNTQAAVMMPMPQQSEEDIKKRKKAQMDQMMNEAMKPQLFNQDLGKYNLNCTICLEEYDKTSKVTLTACNHLFHYACLKNWLMRNLLNNKCPNCNHHLLPELAETGISPNNYIVPQNIQVSHMNNTNANVMPYGGRIGFNSVNANNILHH